MQSNTVGVGSTHNGLTRHTSYKFVAERAPQSEGSAVLAQTQPKEIHRPPSRCCARVPAEDEGFLCGFRGVLASLAHSGLQGARPRVRPGSEYDVPRRAS